MSLCLFHRLHGGDRSPGDGQVSNSQKGGASAAKSQSARFASSVDVADEILFSKILDKFESELRCVLDALPGATERCAVALPPLAVKKKGRTRAGIRGGREEEG